MYKNKIKEFRKECEDLGITLKTKGGLETFDTEFRENVMKKGFGNPTLEELKDTFDEINLLVGVKGQNIEQVEKDIELGLENFERVCVNLYKEMEDIMPGDEELKKEFMEKLYDKYKNNERVDILVENTDFGVGE